MNGTLLAFQEYRYNATTPIAHIEIVNEQVYGVARMADSFIFDLTAFLNEQIPAIEYFGSQVILHYNYSPSLQELKEYNNHRSEYLQFLKPLLGKNADMNKYLTWMIEYLQKDYFIAYTNNYVSKKQKSKKEGMSRSNL
jgi:hypothetical protein